MSNNQQTPKKLYKLSDDVIVMIRELLQLSLLMNTNLVDNFRSLRLEETTLPGAISVVNEETKEVTHKIVNIVPAREYMEAYNKMIQDLEAKLAKQEEAESAEAIVSSSSDDKN